MESGAVLLDDVVRFIRRFVVLSPAQADATALWIAHSHAIAAADCSPYLWITSAVPRSGKTRLLDDVLGLLVHEPIPTANISDAALFRVIAERTPTLLLDEVDAIFGPKARDREDFRGMLCAGYRRGAQTHRMGGANMRELQTFPVFCCKALAGIGEALPDTIKDRAIRIRLERRTREERVDRLRRRVLAPEGEMLRDRLADWTEPQLDDLHRAWPELPDELDDRAQDIREPLFALADLAGGDWPERARAAALTLSSNGEREDDSLSARMLADIRVVFSASDADRFRTVDLIDELCKIEESPGGTGAGRRSRRRRSRSCCSRSGSRPCRSGSRERRPGATRSPSSRTPSPAYWAVGTVGTVGAFWLLLRRLPRLPLLPLQETGSVPRCSAISTTSTSWPPVTARVISRRLRHSSRSASTGRSRGRWRDPRRDTFDRD
jgi:Protein of unknown function (DUF3631)